ncbi:uncharacterized protein LOC116659909 [Camelus ferus]|uniref:Uncharacterized protein LOC116659909 n=1 Tax=Camelus ferus TaxID=419612 RepID=A0A8B8S1W3_CAMFR|nr:uncharacterized protein LOC116659909 [Camelus ferus]
MEEEGQHLPLVQYRQGAPTGRNGMVQSKPQRIEVTEMHPPEAHALQKNPREVGEDSGLPTVEFKAVDLDIKVKDDHRKFADRKPQNPDGKSPSLVVIPKRALQALSQWSPRSQVEGSASLSVVEASWGIKEDFHGVPSEVVTETRASHATMRLLGKKGRSAAQGHSVQDGDASFSVWRRRRRLESWEAARLAGLRPGLRPAPRQGPEGAHATRHTIRREKTVILTNNYTHLWGKSSWTDTSQTQSRDACGKIEGKKNTSE